MPLSLGAGPLGDNLSRPLGTAQGPPLSCANPLPRTLIPLSGTPSLSGGHWADQGHPLGIHALPTPWWSRGMPKNAPPAWGGGCGCGSLPGVDAVLPAEGILDGEAPVVELQGGEAALIQAHHLPVAQGGRLGAVPWGMGCSASPQPLPRQRSTARGGWTLHGGLGMAPGGLCWFWSDHGPGTARRCRLCPAPVPPAPTPGCLLNEELWIFPTI